MLKQEVRKVFKKAIGQEAEIERPQNSKYGDYSTNFALKAKLNPNKIIEKLAKNDLFEKVEKAGPGFINMFLSKKAFWQELEEILEKGGQYGKLGIGQGKKIQIEFISANPTGPLTVGNARGGPYGDALANLLVKAGYQAERAYYVNDAGEQIKELGRSVLGEKEAKYQGDYIKQLAGQNKQKDSFKAGQWAAKKILKDLIKKTINGLGIKFDEWIFESDLHRSGKVGKALDILKKANLTYQKGGAVWFKSKQFGDQRDRVLVKKNGNYTYLAGDIALHYYKFKDKKFDQAINICGADHHGDVPGLMAGVEALGEKGKLEIILLQFVSIIKKGKAQKMSKRAGEYVLEDELLAEVGQDAARFFILQKSPDTHLNFDIDLARDESAKNPVYYIQYAHARISSILNKVKLKKARPKFNLLTHPAELSLIKQLVELPEIIEEIAQDYQIQRLSHYAINLAGRFHNFYEACRVIDEENQALTQARLGLVKACQIVLQNSLALMGISAPKKM